jgi:hypothetical protein
VEEPFDIRIEKDRISLSDFLPVFDGTTFHFTRDDFITGLASSAHYLKNPDWMVYHWGCFVAPVGPKNKLILSLNQLVTLGLQLKRLSCFENFESLIASFRNPSQFEDTLFEVKVANLFAQHNWVIRFAPEQNVRERIKRPDFEATGINGTLYIECKRCHVFVQKALIALNDISTRFKKFMEKCNWPNNLRLEVEIARPLSGNINKFIHTTVQKAIVTGETTLPINIGPFQSHVAIRQEAFRLPAANWITDTMVIGNIATGVLNPEFTMLRVANYNAFKKCEQSVRVRVREALKQLQKDSQCVIFLGDLPFHVGQSVCEKSLNDPAYDNIITFGIWEIDAPIPELLYRDKDSKLVGLFFDNRDKL